MEFDRKDYGELIDLNPSWKVENVIIDTVMKRVGVSIEHPITHSRLEPVIKKVKMIRNHLRE